MNKMKEAEIIKNAIYTLEHGPYKERMPLLKELHAIGYVVIDGFEFYDKDFCWVIWKPTDESVNPEYKGQPLSKIVPVYMDIDKIPQLLDAQQWIYW